MPSLFIVMENTVADKESPIPSIHEGTERSTTTLLLDSFGSSDGRTQVREKSSGLQFRMQMKLKTVSRVDSESYYFRFENESSVTIFSNRSNYNLSVDYKLYICCLCFPLYFVFSVALVCKRLGHNLCTSLKYSLSTCLLVDRLFFNDLD